MVVAHFLETPEAQKRLGQNAEKIIEQAEGQHYRGLNRRGVQRDIGAEQENHGGLGGAQTQRSNGHGIDQ